MSPGCMIHVGTPPKRSPFSLFEAYRCADRRKVFETRLPEGERLLGENDHIL
jgi:hypothetical protein